MPYVKVKVKQKPDSRYRRRKSFFWFLMSVVPVLLILFISKSCSRAEPVRHVRAGICGAVNHEAVYTLREGSDLSILVRMAGGFNLFADTKKVNLDLMVQNDSIYHIPEAGGESATAMRLKFMEELNKSENAAFASLAKEVDNTGDAQDIKMYSILYVGQPAVFVLINYYPQFHRINFVHLPHSTLFMNNEYRLVDLFYSLDIYPTMRIVANKLKQHIDYYLIQDRFEYMDLIDLLGGIDVKLDKEFAKEYKLKAEVQRLDGFYAWEYIRFMDWKNLKMTVAKDRQKDLIRNDNFQIEANNLQYIYEVRNQRQRYVLQGMRKSFVNLTPDQQMEVVQNFDKVFRTDMDLKFLMNLYKDLLSTKEFSFGSLPGYYAQDKTNLYYYPDLPNFEMLRQQEIRRDLEKQRRKGQTVY